MKIADTLLRTLSKRKNHFSLQLIVLLGGILLFPSAVDSKVTCEGKVCDLVPPSLLQEIYQLDSQFQFQYMDKLSTSMAIAGSNSNLASGMIGLGSLNRFQIGAGVGKSKVSERNTSIAYGSTYIDKLPNIGIGISPTFAGGLNLGWAFGLGGAHYEYVNYDDDEDDEDDEEVSSVAPTLLHRFNLYVNGGKSHASTSDFKSVLQKTSWDGDMHFSQWGFMLRFLVFAPGPDAYWFRFMGLSIGAGYSKSIATMNLTSAKLNNTGFQTGNFSGRWIGDIQMNYDLNVRTFPVDIRSGFRLMNFLTLFGGIGYAKHSTDVVLELSRKGPVTLTNDFYSGSVTSSISPTVYNLFGGIFKQEGFLTAESKSYQKLIFGQGYGVFGVEVNVSFLQVFSEFYFTGHRGATGNLGVKLNF